MALFDSNSSLTFYIIHTTITLTQRKDFKNNNINKQNFSNFLLNKMYQVIYLKKKITKNIVAFVKA